MPFVQRTAGVVSGVYACFQAGYAEEYLPPNNAEVTAYLHPPQRVLRTLFAIYTDLLALTAGQKAAIWTNLTAGSPPLLSTDTGPNRASVFVLFRLGANASLPAAAVADFKASAAAMYCQDVPGYLVHPAFDNTINIAGDQLA